MKDVKKSTSGCDDQPSASKTYPAAEEPAASDEAAATSESVAKGTFAGAFDESGILSELEFEIHVLPEILTHYGDGTEHHDEKERAEISDLWMQLFRDYDKTGGLTKEHFDEASVAG